MNASRLLRAGAAAALLALPQAGWPVFDPVNDDTDIFLANPTITAERPNVMIFIDNTANWNTAFATEKASLQAVVGGLNDNFNVGSSMFVETGNPNDSIDGAYIRFGIRQMTATNKAAFNTMVNGLDQTGDKGNNATMSLAMLELFRYFSGTDSYSGFGKVKRDYAGNTAGNPAAASLAGNPFASATSRTYVSPIVDGCQKNFIIVISNGPFGDNSSSLGIAQTDLAAKVGKNPPDTIALSPNGEQGIWADEYAKFMANSDCDNSRPGAFDGVQRVITYTIDVLPGATGQGPAHTAMLKSMATNGRGKYFAITDVSSTSQLTLALNTIFQEVQATNSVFASTTLPVSVNVRGTNLNQVYIGVFRPDANKSPKWLGNLKLYKLGVNTATQPASLFLADATGAPAENGGTGFISGSAKSYWTASSSYWGFRDSDLNGTGGSSDSPDGDLVEKGGAAQQLRLAYPSAQTTRKLYTCVNATFDGPCAVGTSLSTKPFNNTIVTAADLGAFTTYTATSLTSDAAGVATLVLPAAPNPVWAIGDQIKIDGAQPGNYNSLFNLTAADNTTFTYTFNLPAALPSATARANATGHGLQTGDLVTVTTATNTTFNVTDAVVERRDANVFRYPAAGVSGTNGAITVTGKKFVSSVSGSGIAATASVIAHGYATGNTITISGANETAFNKTATITVTGADSFTYSTTPDVITGTSNTAQVTAVGHNISTNQSVRVIGSSVASYNAQVTATRINADIFTFPSVETASGAGGVAGLKITGFSHPGSGSGNGVGCGTRDVLTVTLEANHNITTFPYTITITGGTNEGAGKDFTQYNGTWTLGAQADAPVNPGNTIIITQTTTTNSSPAGICNFDIGGQGAPAGTIIAGKPITAINPIVSATGTIYSGKSVSVQSLSALTTATGAITVGRPTDSSTTVRDQIIAWVRGADNREDENPTTTPAGSDIRPSVHGDVLHSRPAVVNYNRYSDDNDIYVFYGSNDGVFHGLKGGTAAHTTGADTAVLPGTERWGFIPREFFGRLKRLREQTPSISNVSQKDYFADGSIGVYVKDVRGNGNVASPLNCVPGSCSGADTVSGVIGDNIEAISGDKVHLYLSMRRGGDFIYALDVTNPATPKLLWRKSALDTGWELLGQTWSEPKISRSAASLGNSNNPDNVILIFGAGYDDAVEDINPCLLDSSSGTQVVQKAIGTGTVTYTAAGSCTITSPTGSPTTFNRSRGRGILVVDAFDGTVVWQASRYVTTSSTARARKIAAPEMTCAISSDTTVIDKNRDGFADRIYVGDTCGQVWRMDISSTDMDEWVVTKIAALSSATSTDITNKRKFLFPPDLVFGTDASGNYTAVLLGSGDREHPFDAIVSNRFYMLKDRDSSDPGNPQAGAPNATSVKISGYATSPTGAALTDSDVFDATSAYLIDGTDPLGLNGWKIIMGSGEKVVSSATSVAGTVFFNTNQPSATAGGGSCGSNLGLAREYLVGFADASATIDVNGQGGISIADRSTIHEGGGYLPSPVPVVVEIDGQKYQAVISGTSVQTPPGLTLEKRTRAFWYKQID